MLPLQDSPWRPGGSIAPPTRVFSRRQPHAPDPTSRLAQRPSPPLAQRTRLPDTSPMQVLVRFNMVSSNLILRSGTCRLTNNCLVESDWRCLTSALAETTSGPKGTRIPASPPMLPDPNLESPTLPSIG